ncbi:MAG: hypothetical protein JWN46_395 [Acidimicrobiales bacterium]|nr:hypothetical protein [Acidimicrobiales bacterium]
MQIGRWVKYARARLNASVRQGSDRLDELEARQQAELAERPWLAAAGEAPTLDEAKARLAWEAEHRRRPGDGSVEGQAPAPERDAADDAELAAAKLVLDQREQAAKERLEQMRRELKAATDEPGRRPPG